MAFLDLGGGSATGGFLVYLIFKILFLLKEKVQRRDLRNTKEISLENIKRSQSTNTSREIDQIDVNRVDPSILEQLVDPIRTTSKIVHKPEPFKVGINDATATGLKLTLNEPLKSTIGLLRIK